MSTSCDHLFLGSPSRRGLASSRHWAALLSVLPVLRGKKGAGNALALPLPPSPRRPACGVTLGSVSETDSEKVGFVRVRSGSRSSRWRAWTPRFVVGCCGDLLGRVAARPHRRKAPPRGRSSTLRHDRGSRSHGVGVHSPSSEATRTHFGNHYLRSGTAAAAVFISSSHLSSVLRCGGSGPPRRPRVSAEGRANGVHGRRRPSFLS